MLSKCTFLRTTWLLLFFPHISLFSALASVVFIGFWFWTLLGLLSRHSLQHCCILPAGYVYMLCSFIWLLFIDIGLGLLWETLEAREARETDHYSFDLLTPSARISPLSVGKLQGWILEQAIEVLYSPTKITCCCCFVAQTLVNVFQEKVHENRSP